jgi:MtN3 and saliva related transmembrane protein
MVPPTEALGLVAGFLVSFGLVPQILRVWRLRDATEISLPFNLLTLGGTVLWLTYGIALGLFSVILWNGVNCVLYIVLLSVKLKYGMRHGGVAHPSAPRSQ